MKSKKTAKTTAKTSKASAKKMAPKMAAPKAFKKGTKFSVINELHEAILAIATAGKNGAIKIKRTDLKNMIETTFASASKAAASGQRVRFPVIGVLARREVKARKSGKGVNPFTGEEIMIKARPESKKPRWSFPKVLKETFADKKNW
jgi:nucleoid DNA-binding protein